MYSLRVLCGKGTYIRSLAHDLGKALDSGAHLSGLRRIAKSGLSRPMARKTRYNGLNILKKSSSVNRGIYSSKDFIEILHG